MEGFATVKRFRCLRCDNMMEITATENPPVVCDRCGADFREQPEQLVEAGEQDVIRMELLPVRPDMFEPGGLARVLRNYLGETDQPAHYELAPPTCSVTVDPQLDTESCYRPFIACAIVRESTLTDDLVKVVMKLQENLHWAMGRDRKYASIGVYDLDSVSGPDFAYRSVGPDELRFVPLGYDTKREEDRLTPAQILAQHPKGVAYAKLLEGFARYPLLCDAEGQVLSMPPIINSEPTRVRPNTASFFIDVTGTGEQLVNRALNVIATTMAELDPSCKVERVTIVYPDRQAVTPNLTPEVVELDPEMTAKSIGVELNRDDVVRHLRQMGHAVIDPGEGEPLTVQVPAFRNDIMHPVDLVEDVAIAYGYHNIVPVMVPTMTVGTEQESQRQMEVARRAMTGLGYLETLSLTLSSHEADFDALLLPRREDCVLIENPISVEQTIVRTTLLPGLLSTFTINTNHELPQHIFEVGNITLLCGEAETGASEWMRIAAGAIGPKVDYSEIRSACEALLAELGWQLSAKPDHSPCFIPGRGARILACRGDLVLDLGMMGEIHPQVLENHKLVQPVAVFELDLSALGERELVI
jgi:phenylalanyl-tRNA synthetase beta chain